MIVARWQAPPLTPERKHNLLQEALAKAWRAPFFAGKLRAAGFRQGQVVPESEWTQLPLTTKDELRQLSSVEFYRDVVIAPRSEMADYWRSGGVTGKPIFYPRTHQDLLVAIETFRRVLEMAGVRPGDLVANSFPYGVHPLGRMMMLAIQAHGCAAISTGAGNNTQSEHQAELIADLSVDVVLAMATYALHLAHVAQQSGIHLAVCPVRTVISSADMITPAKRARLERLWGVEVFNTYGMSEVGMMSCECERHDGMHVWADLCHLEVLDGETWEPVAPGEVGVLVVTPLYTNNATPFIRWVSGDLVSLSLSKHCGCRSPYRHLPMLRMAGRTTGFFKIRGVNINHSELQDFLLLMPEIKDYLVIADRRDEKESLIIEVEVGPDVAPEAITEGLCAEIARRFEISAEIQVVPQGTIVCKLEKNVKQERFIEIGGRS
ncbi:MAG: AMP-binding protein [Acidobacteria bacterium]|nr:AMP-binding protein [Acidobacteriota bacterium]